MKITVRLDDQLLAEAKEHAARTGRTLTALPEDALRVLLALKNRPEKHRSCRLPTYGEGGLQLGIDLDNSDDLQDLMGGPGAAR